MTPYDPVATPTAPASSDEETAQPSSFPIIGVGASAGGLDAIRHLLENLPPGPGFSLLVAVHLNPSVESQMAPILAQTTPLTVRQAKDGMKLQVDSVYIIPPDSIMTLTDGHISLGPRTGRGPNMQIDHLFPFDRRSAAKPCPGSALVRRGDRRHPGLPGDQV